MLVKTHKAYRTCIAVCDSDLIDKKFKEADKQLDLTGTFFKGEEKTIEETKEILLKAAKEDASFNFVGQESVNLAKTLGIVKEQGIINIKNIPVALVLL